MAAKVKVGRKASSAIRQKAREWATLYRMAQAQPDGRLCLNPQDEREEQTWIDASDPEMLIFMMECLAQHGAFEDSSDLGKHIRNLPMRWEFHAMRKAGTSHEAAVLAMADKYSKSGSTIERAVRTVKT